jgi:hypothetical protein
MYFMHIDRAHSPKSSIVTYYMYTLRSIYMYVGMHTYVHVHDVCNHNKHETFSLMSYGSIGLAFKLKIFIQTIASSISRLRYRHFHTTSHWVS